MVWKMILEHNNFILCLDVNILVRTCWSVFKILQGAILQNDYSKFIQFTITGTDPHYLKKDYLLYFFENKRNSPKGYLNKDINKFF